MSNNPDQLENQQDQEQEDKRPVLFIPIIIVVLLLVLSVAGFAIASGMGAFTAATPTPTETEEATEVAEVTETDEPDVVTFTPVPTEPPTDEPTPTATNTLTPTATEAPTDTPTPTRGASTGPTVTPTDEPVCGDLVCNGSETATTCAQDCGCFDNFICTSAEQAIGTCRDCGPNAGSCGASCISNANCNTAAGLSCVNNFCDASFCSTPPITDEPPEVTCGCQGTDMVCSDGTVTEDHFSCVQEACSCVDWAYDEGGQLQSQSSSALIITCFEPDEPGTAYFACPDPNDECGDGICWVEIAATCSEAEAYGCFDKFGGGE